MQETGEIPTSPQILQLLVGLEKTLKRVSFKPVLAHLISQEHQGPQEEREGTQDIEK